MSRITRSGVVAGASLLTATALVAALASGAAAATLDEAPVTDAVVEETPDLATVQEPAAEPAPVVEAAAPAVAEVPEPAAAPAPLADDSDGEVPDSAPVSLDDSYTTDEGVQLIVSAAQGILANDYHPDLDAFAYGHLVAVPAHGTLSVSTNGAFVYDPAPGFSGVDTWSYVATDNVDDGNVATVTITVVPAYHELTANPDSYSTAAGISLVGNVSNGVTVNDTFDGGPVPAGADVNGVLMPAHGDLVGPADDGSFLYTPDLGFTGVDKFGYSLDTQTLSSYALVTVTVVADDTDGGDGGGDGDGGDGDGDPDPTPPTPSTPSTPSTPTSADAPKPVAGSGTQQLAYTGTSSPLNGLLFGGIATVLGAIAVAWGAKRRTAQDPRSILREKRADEDAKRELYLARIAAFGFRL